ncbi:hypothetical protein ETB97_000426 [Aspergillus alliaceus]|uniref:Uncharacterized protein n=1 Tax=Petromyces alliaceus TaxID=209559 RepID=A0A8H6A674_PETAA|nr:hypothetical protein ETB97_000426 [Aspergillus burnettii]
MASKAQNGDRNPPVSAPDTRDTENQHPESSKGRRWPTNPWEKDFRLPAANATLDEIRDQLGPVPEEFQISDKELRRLQSKEWAEKCRPYCQWMAILKERGLYEEYHQSFPPESTWEERFILPDPGRKGDFCVWKRLVDLVGLTKGWGITKQLIIRLGKIGEVKWWDTEGRNGNSPEIIDEDAIMLPFHSLLNVKSLRIETYSKESTAVIYSSQTICREILNVGNRINNHTNSNEKITEGVGLRLVPQAQ